MLTVVPSDKRRFSNFGWLQTYWLFSFSDYYDPANNNWGLLRVFNDDVVQPDKGFPMHPHEEMEIVTIVLAGQITHEDSLGNRTTIRAGEVQRMSAGTGLRHSEYNLAQEPCHFYQIWLNPRALKQSPAYEQKLFEPAEWQGRLFAVASGQDRRGVIKLNSDATIYRCQLQGGQGIELNDVLERLVFVYLTSGEVKLNGVKLRAGDQARISRKMAIEFAAVGSSDLVVIETGPV